MADYPNYTIGTGTTVYYTSNNIEIQPVSNGFILRFKGSTYVAKTQKETFALISKLLDGEKK